MALFSPQDDVGGQHEMSNLVMTMSSQVTELPQFTQGATKSYFDHLKSRAGETNGFLSFPSVALEWYRPGLYPETIAASNLHT